MVSTKPPSIVQIVVAFAVLIAALGVSGRGGCVRPGSALASHEMNDPTEFAVGVSTVRFKFGCGPGRHLV
jgi:hypothetical protein